MTTERFVVLGLAPARSAWFRDLARWSTTAVVPVEFLKSMSVEEVRVRLRSGRSHSALIVDESTIGLDRDLVDLALETGCAVVVAGNASQRWTALGASAVLPTGFDRAELLHVLHQVATPIARTHAEPAAAAVPAADGGYRGHLIAVTGPGGTGCSTIAMGIAQGLAADARYADLVCLADLALDAEQAMLHGTGDVVPGVLELVDAHRGGVPAIDEVRGLMWQVRSRGYHLLLGLRRHRDWTAVRPRAFDAALTGLRRAFRAVVADVDADLEGESSSGSLDVEERNTMARTTVAAADVVVVVGSSGLKGLHSLLRVTRDVLDAGVPGRRVLPVVNRAPRGPRARAQITAAFGELLTASRDHHGVPSPVHLPDRRHLDQVLRDGVRLPAPWLAPVAGATLGLLDHDSVGGDALSAGQRDLVPVEPGSLGSWTEQAEDA